MINFSILIPHKNRPVLLQKCIDSIPLRDDVQVIIVDDNSSPEIVDFNNFPGKNNPMVQVIFTKEGKGAGYARNVGLPYIKGKWLCITGSDDFFLPDFNVAMDRFVNTEYEVVFFKTISQYLDGSISDRSDYWNETVSTAINYNDFSDVFICSRDAFKFYNVSFLRSYNIMHFHEVRWSNDVFFSANVARFAQKYYASNISIACVTDSKDNLTKDSSIECLVVRFIEEGKSVRIMSPRYGYKDSLHYFFFRRWFAIYKKNKIYAALYLPYAIFYDGKSFLRLFFSALFKIN